MNNKFFNLINIFLLGLVMNNNILAEASSAIFAMGCFWCAETEFDSLAGVKDVTVGYAGGNKKNPTYENHDGYKEAIKVDFDPDIISYEKLLDIFWKNIDPFDQYGQFCDKGFSYTAAIYYQDNEQLKVANRSKEKVAQALTNDRQPGLLIKTEILQATTFYAAEDYHQDYKKKNPLKYKFYRWNCGRDARLAEVWSGVRF